ncbi:osmoprotectant ABC transporter substrate-binding protein, partial [Enterococcus lactis]|nr:osmoprotectant ABC transporter substrate-binding protein [Enterococcus lactis]
PMEIGLVYDAVEACKMDIVVVFATDRQIASYDVVMLEEDSQVFPPDDASKDVDNKVLADTPHEKEA